MCNDDNEGDGTSGDHGGQGTPLTLKTSFGRRSIKADTKRADTRNEETKIDSARADDGHIPSIDALLSRTRIKGYLIGRFQGRWYVFDKDGECVGQYGSRERAVMAALSREDPPSPPPFGHGT